MMRRDAQELLPHVAVTVQDDDINAGAANVLAHIRPQWKHSQISFKMFTDGITNKLVACSVADDNTDIVLVRVYGRKTDLLIDRKAETKNLQVMHNAGYAPRVYATFNNGLAYEYVPGETLSTDSCRTPSVYPLVAAMMARMHRLECGTPAEEAMVWTKTKQFISLTPDQFSNPDHQRRFEELKLPSKAQLESEFACLESELKALNSPLVFCHNDLLLGNVIFDKRKDKVTFIDYEYAAYNHQAFDIGNHFNEFAGVSNVDYSLYPDLDFQRVWLRVYLHEYDALSGNKAPCNGETPQEAQDEQVENLLALVNKFALASHFLWSTWALVQAEHSSIEFDYLEYASVRLGQYYKKKAIYLSM